MEDNAGEDYNYDPTKNDQPKASEQKTGEDKRKASKNTKASNSKKHKPFDRLKRSWRASGPVRKQGHGLLGFTLDISYRDIFGKSYEIEVAGVRTGIGWSVDTRSKGVAYETQRKTG
ncbi:MAG: hypothetical protein WBY44_01335, partial [Bryobacteraceae bacterium]